MLKQLFLFVSTCLIITLTSCANQDEPTISGEAPMLTLRLETSAAQSNMRSTLVSSDNVQHVRYVQLYIFRGTTTDAPCVVSRNVDWVQPIGSTAEQTYALPLSAFSPDGTTYTFLAVGLDDNPSSTTEGAAYAYALPDAITLGTTLGEAKAQLAASRTQSDLAHAELFAGTSTQIVNPSRDNAVTIDLYRRVVGVQVYVTDVPSGVTDLQLVLHADQHSDVPLVKQTDAADGTFLDHGDESLAASTCLLDLPVTTESLKGATVTGTSLVKQEGSVLAACYMLPLEAPTAADGRTLQLRAYKGTALYKTWGVALGTAKARSYQYPLRANCFYTIGALNAQENEPISLGEAESDIVIEVEPNFEKDHDYTLRAKRM